MKAQSMKTPPAQPAGMLRSASLNAHPAPLFSIVTVVLDDREGLERTHASLDAQTCRDFRWIVVDGGSRDGTLDYLLTHRAALAWWRSGPDNGLYDAMNIGMAAADGDYLLFLNAGDELPASDTLARLAAHIFAEGRPDFVYGDALEQAADGGLLVKRARSHRLARYGMFTHHQAMVYRRAFVAGLHFDISYPVGADYAFTLDTLFGGARVAYISAPLAFFAPGGRSQREAEAGRRDQDLIRLSRLDMSAFSRGSIRILQTLAIFVRRRWPVVFETFRCRRMYE